MIFWYWSARIVCRVFCAVCFRFRVYGKRNVPDTGGVILACNHQSFLDPVFCGVGLRRRLNYVARESLFQHKFFAWLIRSLNAIPIGRHKVDISTMKEIIARLKAGRVVCLYPEATRTPDGRIAPFKGGFGLLCRRAQVPVVPVLLDGAFECWPRNRRMFSAGAVTVCYGEPVTPAQIRGMSNEDLARLLTQRLRQMQSICRIKQGKRPYEY